MIKQIKWLIISSTPAQYLLKWSNLALGQYVIVHIFTIKLTTKDKEWSTHKPVSYTHLDVYKRQLPKCGLLKHTKKKCFITIYIFSCFPCHKIQPQYTLFQFLCRKYLLFEHMNRFEGHLWNCVKWYFLHINF